MVPSEDQTISLASRPDSMLLYRFDADQSDYNWISSGWMILID